MGTPPPAPRPSGPAWAGAAQRRLPQSLFQGPPAESKILAVKFAIRRNHWVLIDAKTGGGGEPDWFRQERGYVSHRFPGELYDLNKDPAQRTNLYEAHPEIVKELKAILERYKKDGRSTPIRENATP